MTKEEREFLRVKVSGIKAYFNFLEEKESCSLFLSFAKRKTVSPREGLGETSPFEESLLSSVQRLESKIDFLIRQLDRERYGVPYEFRADVIDIGGGGVNLLSPVPCTAESFLDICLFAECGNSPSIYTIGQVQWVREETGEGGSIQYRVGVEFVEIEEDDREALFRAIFDLDRRQKRQLNAD